jgi:hypothetical protein
MKRHRHQEFIRFLNVIEARVSKKKTIHVIVDNYATHIKDRSDIRNMPLQSRDHKWQPQWV